MTRKHLTFFIGTILILAQIVIFKDYLPFLSQKIVVNGIVCTCPDAEVVSGEEYLKSITPDSLKKYNLDYSEIYFQEKISNLSDPLGADEYIVTGNVIGKRSISHGDDHYYPLFEIKEYKEAAIYNFFKWMVLTLLIFEILVLFMLSRRKRRYFG